MVQHINEKTHCHYFVGYSFQLAARDLFYAPFHRQNSTYYGLFAIQVMEHWLKQEIAQWWY